MDPDGGIMKRGSSCRFWRFSADQQIDADLFDKEFSGPDPFNNHRAGVLPVKNLYMNKEGAELVPDSDNSAFLRAAGGGILAVDFDGRALFPLQ